MVGRELVEEVHPEQEGEDIISAKKALTVKNLKRKEMFEDINFSGI